MNEKFITLEGLDAFKDEQEKHFPSGGGDVKAENGKLLISEVKVPVLPEPVATIDGVTYYHKHEFDLESMMSLSYYSSFDIFTEDQINYNDKKAKIFVEQIGGGPSSFKVISIQMGANGSVIAYCVYASAEHISYINYTSREFTPINVWEEVNENTEIYAPGCTAYYGELSQDGTKFTSYWNEEADTAIKPITEIKDENNHIADVHDKRINPSSEDAGKVLTINNNGNIIFEKPGVKFYSHSLSNVQLIDLNDGSSGGYGCTLICSGSKPITSLSFNSFTDLGIILGAQKHVICSLFIINLGGSFGLGVIVNEVEYNQSTVTTKYYKLQVSAGSDPNDTVTAL